MREHKRKENETQRGSAAHNVDLTQLLVDNDENSLKDELETCKYFSVYSEIENGRHRVYNFAMDTPDPKNLLEKLDVALDSLKCAAKVNLAFIFVLINVENGCFKY